MDLFSELNKSLPLSMHFHCTLSIELSTRLRPSLVLDSLEKALLGCRELLAQPAPSAVVVKSGLRIVEYQVTGYVKSRDRSQRCATSCST
jgi:hypothetical protein